MAILPASWQWYNAQYSTAASTTALITNVPAFTTTTSTTIYANWNQGWPLIVQPTGWYTGGSSLQWTALNTRYEETKEQRAIRVRAEAEQSARLEREWAAARERMQVRERERREADKLAGNLLLACLSPAQATDHLERGWFDVTSSRGRRFRIHTKTAAEAAYRPGQAGNVVLLDAQGRPEAQYCVHPPDNLPHADAWLAQKLALEADEDTVMRVANMPWSRAGHADIRTAARERLRLVA